MRELGSGGTPIGFFTKLFGSGKKEVTPDKMAHVVLDAAVQLGVGGDESLREMLLSAGIQVENEVEFQAELIAFQLFLFDVIVNRTFGPDAEPIRTRIRERFANLAVRVAGKAGVEPKSREAYIAFLEDRFREYTPALRRSMESEGAPEQAAHALSDAVLGNVAGPGGGNLQAVSAVYDAWLNVFKEYPEALQEYEIVAEE